MRTLTARIAAVVLLAFAGALPLAATTQEVAEALVVQVESSFGEEHSESGSGILVGHEHGYLFILTANHVVRRGLNAASAASEASEVAVRFRFWRQELVTAELLDREDRGRDLALLRVHLGSVSLPAELVAALSPAADGAGVALRRGDRVYPVGHPQGRPWYVPVDPPPVVEALASEFRFEYACEGGYSGGGVFDSQWRLRGMIQRWDGKVCIGLDFATIRQVAKGPWGIPMNLVVDGGAAPAAARPEAPAEVAAAGPRMVAVLADGPDKSLATLAESLFGSAVSRQAGAAVVERDRVDAIAKEQDFRRFFGDDENASALGGMVGADLVVLVTLADERVERRSFSGYGLESVADHYALDASVRIVEVLSGRVVHAATFEGRHREIYNDAATAPAKAMDRGPNLVRKIAEDAEAELSAALAKRAGG